jgi:hypothetical protein
MASAITSLRRCCYTHIILATFIARTSTQACYLHQLSSYNQHQSIIRVLMIQLEVVNVWIACIWMTLFPLDYQLRDTKLLVRPWPLPPFETLRFYQHQRNHSYKLIMWNMPTMEATSNQVFLAKVDASFDDYSFVCNFSSMHYFFKIHEVFYQKSTNTFSC